MSLLRLGLITALVGACAFVGCETNDDDASTGGSAGGPGQGGAGGQGASGGEAATGGQGGTGGEEACDVDCQKLDLVASFGANTLAFERAYYGLSSPANSSSGQWEIYLEAYRGGDPGCPTASSATPATTLVLAGHPAPLPSNPIDMGLAGSVLDFDGQLLGGPVSSAVTAATSTPTASSICIECVGTGADPDGFVAMDVTLTFAEGTIAGHIYATHCESLDVP